MTPERWKQVEDVFQSALDLPPDERPVYIAEACTGDDALREHVEALVAQYEEAGDFIEEPVMGVGGLLTGSGVFPTQAPQAAEDPMKGRRIGAYRVVRELGRGGMGAVYLAERADSEFRRRVAIKLIKRGMDTDFILRRFRNERQILASLDHPNIARMLDGGTTDDGLPYFVMEYIEGLPVYRYCDERKLTIPERLRLFRQICDAVHYAHRNLVIHRDIKPSNILLTADGTPKLLDFGIAKLLNPDLADITIDPTATAMRLMTPEYASPEQVQGQPVSPATDVYSLGVLLYELLTGHRPYRLRNRAPHEVARVICEDEPAHPSIRITSPDDLLPAHPSGEETATLKYLYWSRGATVETLRRELSGDLDNIVMKALRKEVERRYESAEQMRDDITRHLEGHPVSAPPYFPAAVQLPPRAGAETTADENSIAILPLKLVDARGGDTGDEYLGVGLADALITRLGSLRRFALRPTSSVLRYDTADADPLAAGRELGVRYVLEGRVRRWGGRIRVTMQLLDVRGGSAVWAGRFDEEGTDVLSLEDAISGQVAEALVPQMTGGERLRLAKRGTDNPEAYEAYLRGRYHWSSFTEEGLAKALIFYNQAVSLDPNYALAYSGIADYYNWLGVYAVMPFAETSAAAKEAALKAVALDDSLAEGYSALGFATLTHDFDWVGAERQHRRAVELNPNYSTGHMWYGYQLMMEGRFDESLSEVRRAIELDPLSPLGLHTLSWCHYRARRFEESVVAARRLVAAAPQHGVGRLFLGVALSHLGEHREAISEVLAATGLLGRSPYVLSWLASVYAAAGDGESARDILREIEGEAANRYASPYLLALAYCILGEHERALALLEQALAIDDAWLLWLATEPQLDGLRGHPRFDALLRRTNNPAAYRRAALAETAVTGQKTVAVLPLKVLGPQTTDRTGDEYLGVGLADALITRLSAVRRFVVRPTSSVLRYRGDDVDPLTAGRELGVDYVVYGTIRRSGDRIRVSAQLLSVNDDSAQWAERFDEKFTDVLSLEDSISEQVARALVPQLTGEEQRRLSKRGTDDAEAFEAFLRGRYHWNSMTEDGFVKAITCYRRAVSLDPSFAAAYAGIAEYHCWLAVYGLMPPAGCLAEARAAAERAIELDDTLAEAHTAHGLALLTHETQWRLAEVRFRRAIELNPNYAPARTHYACQLAMEGRFDESIVEARRACQIDPLNPFNLYILAWCLYQARRFDESIEQAHLLLRSEPRYGSARFVMSWALRRVGAYDKSVAEAKKAIEAVDGVLMMRATLACSYAEAGLVEEARGVLDELRASASERFVTPYHLALVHVHLGEREEALSLLERAVEASDPWVVWLAIEPQLDPLRGHPRFDALLRRTQNPAALRVTAETLAGEKSVAVLPLRLLNPADDGDADEGYLGVGLADALITRLSSVQRFVVRPTSSVLRYQTSPADALAAGRELGVDYVVEGTIRRAGDRIRVSAQLLSVAEGATQWACSFDESYTDVLALEDSISEQVARALVPRLTGEEQRRLSKRGTDNPEAFAEYLRGRYYWNTFTVEGFAKALVCYNRAVTLAPDYALAHAGIADYYTLLGVYAVMPFAETSAAAKEAALKAVALDDSLAEGYSALGFATLTHDFDWQLAEQHMRRAVELNPNYALGRLWYCYFLGMAGRFGEASAQMRRALEIDPLSSIGRHALGWTFYYERRYEESVAAARKLAASEPLYGLGHVFLCLVLSHTGHYDEAVKAGLRGVELIGRSPYTLAWLASAYASGGRREQAEELLAEIRQMSATRYASPYLLAMVHRNLGDDESALAELERALAIRDARLAWLGVDPQFDALRGDPRFDAVLKGTNNPLAPRRADGEVGGADARKTDARVARAIAPEPARSAAPSAPTNAPQPAPSPVTTPPRATKDDEAHQLYVAGRYYATRRTTEGLRQAIERFERAVERDPQFALAYAEMADCHALLNWYVEPPPAGAWERARQSAVRAVEADDTLAEAHASLGFVKLHYERDWAGAEREFRLAIALKSENVPAHRWYAFNLSAMGRHDEAVAEIRRAQEISPRSPVVATALANVLFLARRYDEAIEQCRKALELDAGSVAAYVVLRWAYEKKGVHEEALSAFEQERIFAGDTPTTRAKHAHVLAACGRREEAREVVGELLARRDEQWVTAYEIAVIYSLLGDLDSAFRWLTQAEREHAVGYTFVRVDPHLDNLRLDPRFDELLRRANYTPRDFAPAPPVNSPA